MTAETDTVGGQPCSANPLRTWSPVSRRFPLLTGGFEDS